jgi:hypothetical protein
MRSTILSLLFAAAAAAIPGFAAGYTCYLVYDRNGNTIFQAMMPPVDMSDRGAAEREALRNRGELLLIIESERCPTLTYAIGAGGTREVNFDSALVGVQEAMPSAMGSGDAPRRSRAAPQRSGTSNAAPPGAPGSSPNGK